MRTLKKTLCLVLVVVMMMGLCAVGASAASLPGLSSFNDQGDIQYKEAVAVLTGIGAINGIDGSFQPDGFLTREQAAKIITYIVLGASQAESLKANSAPFSDVAADRWSASYIAYCVSEGIIAGNGDGTFDPTAQLTGYQWAKMLLVALGYDPAIEGFTGSSWAINVAKKALSVGLFEDNLDGNFTTPCTRDEACLYAYNALTADMVEYPNSGTTVSVGGATVVTGASNAQKVEGSTANGANYDGEKGDGIQQFCEEYWPKLILDNTSVTNSFGAPSDQWTYKGEKIGTYAQEDDGSITVSAVNSASKKTLSYWVQQIDSDFDLEETSATAYTKVFVNGDEFTTGATGGWASDVYNYGNTLGTNKAHLGIGDVITVYDTDNDNVIDTVIVKQYVGAKISAVDTQVSTTDAAKGVTAYITINGTDYKPGTDDDDVKLPGYSANTYVKNAIVGVAYQYDATAGSAGDVILDSYIATSAQGTASAYTAPVIRTTIGNITVGGTKYTFNESLIGSNNSYTSGDYTGTYAVYTDQNGYALYIKTVEAGDASSDALYVNYLYTKTANDAYGTPATTYYAQVVDMTGADSVLTLGYTAASGKIYGNISGQTFTAVPSTSYPADNTTMASYWYVNDSGHVVQGANGTTPTGIYGTLAAKSLPLYTVTLAALTQNDLYTKTFQSSDEYYQLTSYVSGSTYYVNELAAINPTTTDIATDDTKLGGYYVNDDTKYLIVEGVASEIDVTVKTGGASLAKTTYSAVDVIATKSGSSYIADYVIIYTDNYTSGQYDNLLYYKNGTPAAVDGGYQYTLYAQDGTSTTYTTSNSNLSNGGAGEQKFYSYTIDSKGVYTLKLASTTLTITPPTDSWDGENGVLYNATFSSSYEDQITLYGSDHSTQFSDIDADAIKIVDLHTTVQDDYTTAKYTVNADYSAWSSVDKYAGTTYSGSITTLDKASTVADTYIITGNIYVNDDGAVIFFITDVSK